jgi:glycosyltransferase involved in cell wall biosynthesis
MRIAHVLSSFGMGGQERVALDLASGQLARGHEVTAVSLAPPPDGPLAAELAARGIALRTVPKRDGFDPTLPIRLALHFVQLHLDIVHTHNPQPLIYGALASKCARAGVVHTKHGANPDGGRRLRLRRAAARFADVFVAVSETTAEIARRNREVGERKLRTIPNGIDLSRFFPDASARAEVRRELGIPEDAWVAGTVGRLAPEKEQALLILALAPLLANHSARPRHLLIVGDGPERARLEDAVAALGEPGTRVHLTGARKDVPRLLRALDAFVLSSSTEGLPLVIPEAMASGLPVVSTAVGGIPGVVEEGETGFLVAAGDGAALAARLERLASEPALVERFGRRARQIALDRYSADRMVRDYLDVYGEILNP